MNLDEAGFGLEATAYLSGAGAVRARNWLDRYGLLPPSGRGEPRLFTIRDVFRFAAVRALIDHAGIAATRAVEAMKPYCVYGSLLTGEPFVLKRTPEGRWASAWGADTPALIVIQVDALWTEMRPRFAERYPSETSEFVAKLADLRARRAAGE